jgi:hypothetical protein
MVPWSMEMIAMTSSLLHHPAVRLPVTPAPAGPGRLPGRLSVAATALMAVAATAGLWADGLYRESAGLREMFRGYDFVTLVVAVPTLAVSLALANRGSIRSRMVWLGSLGFAVYTYALYVFGSSFNDVFLVHVAILILASVALALGVRQADIPGLVSGFGWRAPTRFVAGILAFLSVGLGGMWIFYAVRFAVTGDPPVESELVVPLTITHLGYALDLSLLVPAYAATAVLLWRRAAWGLVVAPVLLIAGVLQQLTYMTALVFQVRADVPEANAFDAAEPFVLAAYVLGAWLLLRQFPKKGEEARR